MHFLDFEKSIIELEAKIKDLSLNNIEDISKNSEIFSIRKEINNILEKTYSKLTPWQITQVARHPERPHAIDYIENLISNFQILSGDRKYGEDKAIIGGIGSFNNYSVMVIGQERDLIQILELCIILEWHVQRDIEKYLDYTNWQKNLIYQ